MMRPRTLRPPRRQVLQGAATGLAIPWLSRAAQAQPRKVPAIGYLAAAAPPRSDYPELRDRLQDLGYADGLSLRLVERNTGGRIDPEALGRLAAELVREGVDVIVTQGRLATRAARGATDRVPIVMAGVGGASEFVSDLSRPSGNITGFVLNQDATDAKLFEILREMVPQLSKLAILRATVAVAGGGTLPALEQAARAAKVDTFYVDVAGVDELAFAFESIVAEAANGLVILNNASFVSFREQIASLALRHRLAGAVSAQGYARAGLLAAYYADWSPMMRNVARYVDLLIRGARVADLPVQEPTQFNLVINLKTAAALGVTVPSALLVRADEVIE